MAETEPIEIQFPEGKTVFKVCDIMRLIGVAPGSRQLIVLLSRTPTEVPYEVIGKGIYYDRQAVRTIADRLAQYRSRYPDAGIPRGRRGNPHGRPGNPNRRAKPQVA